MPKSAHQRPFLRRGFTIVELLVVIGIIAILISLVTISLSRAGQTARQTQYLSNLRQVGTGWELYTNQNDDRLMPGYMDDGVQQAFRVKCFNRAGDRLTPDLCRTYPFRILPFLDHDRTLMFDYIDDFEDVTEIPNDVIANNPAFGINAYYVGGWWITDQGQPRMRYSGTGYFRSPGNLVANQEVVVRAKGQIERSSELVVFSSSYAAQPGFAKNPFEGEIGAAWVVPHRMATTDIWTSSDGGAYDTMVAPGASGLTDASRLDPRPLLAGLFRDEVREGSQILRVQGDTGIQVFVPQAVPLRRIRNVVQTMRADLSTQVQGLRDLMNQGRWINPGGRCDNPVNFSHPNDGLGNP